MLRHPAPQGGPRTLEGTRDRVDGGVEHGGHLGGGIAEHVTQHEHGHLTRRQELEGGHEREGDRLALFVASRGVGRPVDHAVEECVGDGLEPDDLAEARGLRRVDSRHVPLLRRSSRRRAPRVEAPVGRDAVQPGAKRRAAFERGEALPRGEQGVLQRVLGVADRAQHPIAVHLQFALVRRDEFTERFAVARPRPRDQVIRHHAHARHPPSERPAPHCMDTGRPTEWAVGGSPVRGIRRGLHHRREETPCCWRTRSRWSTEPEESIGGAVARAFAEEGAEVFLTGRAHGPGRGGRG